MGVLDKFIKYIKFDTMSDEKSETTPSTPGQMILALELQKEMKALGLETNLDENGYLFAVLKANTDKKIKKLGLLAHLDTSPDMSGKSVNPRIICYEGGDIVLNDELQVIMKELDFPNLENYVGQDIIVTDGKTLLGADDKAGVAEIMTVLEEIVQDSTFIHGDIFVAFTPDEEIGRGPHKFDVKSFGAEIAYTLDGGPVGELQFENFNAASAKVKVRGRNVHPGTAKDTMINSIFIAMDFIERFDRKDTPEHTEKYEGFFHLNEFIGDVEGTTLDYIIRDFFEDTFEGRKAKMREIEKTMNERYGEGTVTVEIKDQYKNMRKMVEPHMYLVENAKKAMAEAGVEPILEPIRGGTDGAQLSYLGLPCPNIFTGGENFHGKFEFISVQGMQKAVEVIRNLIGIYAEEN